MHSLTFSLIPGIPVTHFKGQTGSYPFTAAVSHANLINERKSNCTIMLMYEIYKCMYTNIVAWVYISILSHNILNYYFNHLGL